jgi:hypothetical protein
MTDNVSLLSINEVFTDLVFFLFCCRNRGTYQHLLIGSQK